MGKEDDDRLGGGLLGIRWVSIACWGMKLILGLLFLEHGFMQGVDAAMRDFQACGVARSRDCSDL